MKRLFKVMFLISLTFLLVSAFFFTTGFASGLQSFPWDIDMELSFQGQRFFYSLRENSKRLSSEQIELRGVYLGSKGKEEIVKSLIEEGFTSQDAHCFVLFGFFSVLRNIENAVNREGVDAKVDFHPEKQTKFSYKEGRAGRIVDKSLLFFKILQCVGRGRTKLAVPTKSIEVVTVEDLKAATQKRSQFSTEFPNSSANRVHNIALAAKKINGTVVNDGEVFSFNQVVGNRTEKEGYKSSKVILNGEYVDDFGGGVCQVSTTLYNAVLLSNLKIVTASQHSLVPLYIEPGFDAMVSFPNSDLKFKNDTGSPIFVEARVEGRKVTFVLYGLPSPFEIQRQSVEIERRGFETVFVVDQKKYPELVFSTDTKVIRNGSDFVKSQSYLIFFRDGKEVHRQLIRKNTYKQVDKLIARGATEVVEGSETHF